MPGFTVGGGGPAYVDSSQGASDRLASWLGFTADASPMITPETTLLLRQDDNGGVIPLGQGGCGSWAPILDGSSNGATSGGDNPFYLNGPVTNGALTDNGGVVVSDFDEFSSSDDGLPDGAFFSNGGEIDIAALSVLPNPSAPPILFSSYENNASGLISLGGADLPLTSGPLNSGILWNNGGGVGIQGVLSIS